MNIAALPNIVCISRESYTVQIWLYFFDKQKGTEVTLNVVFGTINELPNIMFQFSVFGLTKCSQMHYLLLNILDIKKPSQHSNVTQSKTGLIMILTPEIHITFLFLQ